MGEEPFLNWNAPPIVLNDGAQPGRPAAADRGAAHAGQSWTCDWCSTAERDRQRGRRKGGEQGRGREDRGADQGRARRRTATGRPWRRAASEASAHELGEEAHRQQEAGPARQPAWAVEMPPPGTIMCTVRCGSWSSPSVQHGDLWPWIEQASKRLHRNMLAMALANKLARIVWAVLARGRAY